MTTSLEAYVKFVKSTDEKEKIAGLIRQNIDVKPTDEVLDIGSAYGEVARLVQPNTGNITMVDIIDQKVSDCTYIKAPFQNLRLDKKYDLVLASHVWSNFPGLHYVIIDKIAKYVHDKGHLVLVYNTNEGLFGEMTEYVRKLIPGSSYDHLNLSCPIEMCADLNDAPMRIIKNGVFNVLLQTDSFDELAMLSRNFFTVNDTSYTANIERIKNFLSRRLISAELVIEQRMVICEKNETK